jgi:hypothetical protein
VALALTVACAQKQKMAPPEEKGANGTQASTVRIDVYSGRLTSC